MSSVPFDPQPTLVGDLLELRPLRPDDFDALFRVASDPLIWEQHPDRDRWQETVFRSFFQDALDSGGAFVAVDRASSKIIGSSRYHGHDAARGVVEIGWTFLARAYWGGRYNGEMKRLMLRHAFRWVDRVLFVIGPDNLRSQRAVEKLGAVRSGTTTDARGRERVVYELTPERYDAAGEKNSSPAQPSANGATFRSHRTLAHPPGRVFEAFARPELLARWWGPDGFSNTFEEFELRPGGRWRNVMHGPKNTTHRNESVFLEVEASSRIVIHHVSPPRYVLTVTMAPKEGGTAITWSQEFEEAKVADRIRHIVGPANEQNLDRLEAVLAGGNP